MRTKKEIKNLLSFFYKESVRVKNLKFNDPDFIYKNDLLTEINIEYTKLLKQL